MHSAAQHEGGVRQGCALHLLQARATAGAIATAGYPWVGGVDPVAGDAVNPSMGAWPRHPCRGHSAQPDPPRLRQISAICRSTPCVDESLSDNEINRGQIRFPKENGSDPMTPRDSRTYPTVTGRLSKAGRCGLAGPLAPWMAPSSPPWTGLRRVLPAHTAPPNQQRARAALALALAVALASAGAGRSPADPPSPAHENDFTDFSKPSSLRHASTILRSSMRPRATHAKNRPPIA